MNTPLVCFVGIFLFLLIIGSPIYLSLLVSAISYFLFHPEIRLVLLPQRMIASLDSFVLIAVPMFLLSGNLMNNGGVTDKLFAFTRALLGHLRGGLAYVNVLASLIFSGMSGSALADVGGLGQVEIKAMRDDGYDDDLTFGVTAASSVLGPIVPPSVPMVVYGAVANVSVGGLFLGGIIPGLVMTVVLFGFIFLVCRHRNYRILPRASVREIAVSFARSFASLLLPVIIMGSIWGGYATPTEAGMLSVVYVLFLLLVIYRSITLGELARILVESVESIVPSLTIVSACALFGWVLQFEHFSDWLISAMFSISDNKYVILLIINVILLFFGMTMDPTPIIMMMVPIILPLGRAIGVHDVQMGVMVILNLMIGLMTPPIGGTLFMLATVTKSPIEYVVRCTYRWLLPLFLSLALVAVVPALTLAIPKYFGFIR